MEQRTHAWIATRAIALLEEKNEVPTLVELLKTQFKAAAIGAWLPDKTASKRAHGRTENHIFKFVPLPAGADPAKRFVTSRADLAARLGQGRAVAALLLQDTTLTDAWWQQPYKADAPPGQHIPNSVNGLRLSIADLLALGAPELQQLTKIAPAVLKTMAPAALTQPAQAAMYFMIVSHFIADASMPFHCDKRSLAGYDKGLHKELEEHWADGIDPAFDEVKLLKTTETADALLARARKADAAIGLAFTGPVPAVPKGRDAWLEMVDVCRASFAISSLIAPPDRYPYGGTKLLPFATAFGGAAGKALLARIDRAALHDAVLNTAIIWKDAWLDAGAK